MNKAQSWGKNIQLHYGEEAKYEKYAKAAMGALYIAKFLSWAYAGNIKSLLSQEVQRGCWWQSDKCQGWGGSRS